jgi:ferritin
MLGEKMQQNLNEQLQKEFYSAYFYLSMEAWFTSLNLKGFANYFRVQLQEERDHAMKIFNYITHDGGTITLLPIAAPKKDFKSPAEVFELSLEHEKFVTRSIYNLVDVALEVKDHSTYAFLQWYITEQVEEEANMDGVLKRLKLVENDGRGILLLDGELAARVYVPIPLI